MNRTTRTTLSVLAIVFVAADANAQWNVAQFGAGQNRVYTTFGLDPALITSVGYGRVTSIAGHPFLWSGDVGVVSAGLDANDFRGTFGVQASVLRWRSMHITGTASAIARGTENSIYRGINFGADITGSIGVYRPRWFAASEFGKDKAVITHVTHSDWYRTYFYPDAKDGWYLEAGGTLHYGVAAGVTLGRTEIVGRFGWLKSEEHRELMPPVYSSVGFGIRY